MTSQVVEKSVYFFKFFQEQIHPDDPITQLTDRNCQNEAEVISSKNGRKRYPNRFILIQTGYFSKSSVSNEILTALKSKRNH